MLNDPRFMQDPIHALQPRQLFATIQPCVETTIQPEPPRPAKRSAENDIDKDKDPPTKTTKMNELNDYCPQRADTSHERLEALVRETSIKFKATRSLAHLAMTHLFRALVTWLCKFSTCPMPETILHNVTVHSAVQLFAAMDGEDPPETANLHVEAELGM
jgi:hypothetical protein